MKEQLILEDKLRLIEQELATLADRMGEFREMRREMEDLRLEVKGLKLFLGRVHKEFKADFPGIMRKAVSKP